MGPRASIVLAWLWLACSAPPADQASTPTAAAPTQTASVWLDLSGSVKAPPMPAPPMPLVLPLKDGYFTCGNDEQCKAHTFTCCNDAECLPRGKETIDDCFSRSECDVSSDCRQGERCCIHSYAMATPYYYRRCEAQCREAEACREGTCPAGQVCWGVCSNPKVETRCGDALSCSGDKPWCDWNATDKRGQCSGPGDAGGNTFHCDDDGDCLANERCWLGVIGSWCCRGESCFDHAGTTKFVACKTKRDCPAIAGLAFDCVADEDLPPHLARRCDPHAAPE